MQLCALMLMFSYIIDATPYIITDVSNNSICQQKYFLKSAADVSYSQQDARY